MSGSISRDTTTCYTTVGIDSESDVGRNLIASRRSNLVKSICSCRKSLKRCRIASAGESNNITVSCSCSTCESTVICYGCIRACKSDYGTGDLVTASDCTLTDIYYRKRIRHSNSCIVTAYCSRNIRTCNSTVSSYRKVDVCRDLIT